MSATNIEIRVSDILDAIVIYGIIILTYSQRGILGI